MLDLQRSVRAETRWSHTHRGVGQDNRKSQQNYDDARPLGPRTMSQHRAGERKNVLVTGGPKQLLPKIVRLQAESYSGAVGGTTAALGSLSPYVSEVVETCGRVLTSRSPEHNAWASCEQKQVDESMANSGFGDV